VQRHNLLKKISTWDAATVRHILSRSVFGFTQQEVDFALTKTLDEFVDDYLLEDITEQSLPGDWVNEVPIPNNGTVDRQRFKELTYWWYDLMKNQGYTLAEKMALLWHNHFVSEISVAKFPQYLYKQNKLFRDFAFGNVKELTKAVTIDPAMLIYLDGRKNSKRKPNENYGRELLELFTLGVGNYSETDIVEASKALTGWRLDGLVSQFVPNRFDNSEKTFLGETGNFNHEDIIDIIFTQDAVAEWFCKKLYKEFVYYEPNETYINELAVVMRNNNYELKPVLSTLLKSEYFHSEEIRGAKIKSPIELIIGLMRQFLIGELDYNYLRKASIVLQQELYNPPDVKGWEGQRHWISTNTYPLRNVFTDSIVEGKKYGGGKLTEKVNVVIFARSFASVEDAVNFVEDVTKLLIQFPLSTLRKEFLLQTLLDGSSVYDWSTYNSQAESRLKKFFKALLRLPEYQLS